MLIMLMQLNKSIDRTTQDSKLRTLLDCVDEVEVSTSTLGTPVYLSQ